MGNVINTIQGEASWVELSTSHKLDGGCHCGAIETSSYQSDGSGYARYTITKVYNHKSNKGGNNVI
jgi:hypothetical protein